jgi:hypothetical protein
VKYSVDPPALNSSADRVCRALDAVGGIRVDEEIGRLSLAFAGGVTAARLKSISNEWSVQLSGARAHLRTLCGALVEAADGYGGLESRTVQQFGKSATGSES